LDEDAMIEGTSNGHGMSPTLRQLHYFAAVGEELHFGRAASRLHVTQPALSQQIQRLERIVGVTLLARDRRSVELTPAGEALLRGARRILSDVDAAVAAARAEVDGGAPLRIGYSPTVDWFFLPSLLALTTQPGAPALVLMPTGREFRPQDLLTRRFDVALTRHFSADEELAHEVLLWERPGVYLSRGDPLAGCAEIPLRLLEGRRIRTVFDEVAPLRCEALRRDVAAAALELEIDSTLGFAREVTEREIAAGRYVVLGYSTAACVFPQLAVVPLAGEVAPFPLAQVSRADDERPAVAGFARLAREAARIASLPASVWRERVAAL
jgi:DNA-binding transcriptional LysR family regulator